MITRADLDEADIRILAALQEDGTLSIAALSEAVNLSPNTCWRRLRRLENENFISRRVALLNAEALGLDLTAFVSIKTNEHTESWLENFSEAIREMPEIVELYRMTGDVDYLMKLRVSSIGNYDNVYKRLIKSIKFTDVSSAFSMEEIKYTTKLPITDNI